MLHGIPDAFHELRPITGLQCKGSTKILPQNRSYSPASLHHLVIAIKLHRRPLPAALHLGLRKNRFAAHHLYIPRDQLTWLQVREEAKQM
jgi:hypothetical protein